MKLYELFNRDKPVIGMLHLQALPGSPAHSLDFNQILDTALSDVDIMVNEGIDGIIIENFGDVPFYPDQVPVHTVSYMTRIAMEVKQRINLPLGINVLRNDAKAAIAIASAIGAEFIRVNIHTGCMVTDQGLIQGKAHETLRMRTQIQSTVKIFADVLVKHAIPLGPLEPDQAAKDTFFRGNADAIIISGSETGIAPDYERIQIIKNAIPTAPILIGSGMTASNLDKYIEFVDGFIIGTWFKKDEITTNPVERDKVGRFMKKIQKLRVEASTS